VYFLSQVKALEHLAILIASRHDRLKSLVAPLEKRGCSEAEPTPPSSPVRLSAPPEPKGNGDDSAPAGKVRSRSGSKKVQDQSPLSQPPASAISPPPSKKKGRAKPSPSKADPWGFPCVEEEATPPVPRSNKPPSGAVGKADPGAARGRPLDAPARRDEEEAAEDKPSGDELGRASGGAGETEAAAGMGHRASEGPFGSLWRRVTSVSAADLLSELRLLLTVLENATFTCVENEDEVIRMQVWGVWGALERA